MTRPSRKKPRRTAAKPARRRAAPERDRRRGGEMEFEFRAAREDFVRESADDDSGAVARR